MWPRYGVSLAAVVGVSPGNDAEDGVIVRDGVLQTFEDDSANRICSTIARCLVIECVAVSFISR
jgi:hypothetical protein